MRHLTPWSAIAPLILGILVIAFGAGTAHAQPAIPATFYGTVAFNGESVPDGTQIRAYIDGRDCTQEGRYYRGSAFIDGVSQYSIEVMHESQQEGCGVDGAEVHFTVDGESARQTAVWAAGPQRVDLSVGTDQTLELPEPAPTDSSPSGGAGTPSTAENGGQAAAPDATARAESANTPGANESPPLDEDVDLDQVLGDTHAQRADPGGRESHLTATEQNQDDDNGGVSGWIIAFVGGLVAVGIVAGWILAGRRRLS